ncbi:hypothetical protein PQO01_10395 [Lentisphaera marina]|uniref:hypothetical protein n=1 Tax=Lentisphaera marina TaxID=1111041 RepID=UPI002365E31E|nr:hypothetical protein [Lentisphaera marina]MDD7985362.1 hypothetical protein [Lentisphaera marina]
MKESEVRKYIIYIINKYVDDPIKKGELLLCANTADAPPVRGIFSDLNSMDIEFETSDAGIIKDIFYYFG